MEVLVIWLNRIALASLARMHMSPSSRRAHPGSRRTATAICPAYFEPQSSTREIASATERPRLPPTSTKLAAPCEALADSKKSRSSPRRSSHDVSMILLPYKMAMMTGGDKGAAMSFF